MAIRIFEHNTTGGFRGSIDIAPGVPLASQTGTVGATTTQSAAFNSDAYYVEVEADEACHVVFGDNPTATTAGRKVTADQPRVFGVQPGDKVAWIQA